MATRWPMTKRTSDSEDFADYTDDHQDKAPVDENTERMTPDVADTHGHEPPD